VEKRIKENLVAAANKVVLNIGGKRFATPKTNSPASDGSYSIDHNPKQFDILLDYLRKESYQQT